MEYFEYGDDPERKNLSSPHWEFDIEALLEESQQRERQRLETALEQISQQLEDRDQLNSETLEDLESKLEWYLDRLRQLYRREDGKHGDRETVKDRIQALYEQVRVEKRTHWRDRQDLEREKRELRRELAELEDTDWLDTLL